jgi:hypothetical protein
MLRSVLLRLVTPSLDGDPVRCRVPSRTLVGDPGRERVVALLVRSRLVTADEDTVEVAHEALARAWPRLQSWLDDDAAGQRILRHLSTAADGWESLGRSDSELYRGGRLDTALEWRDAAQPQLTDVERAFLEASAARAASESREMAERARRDARQNRRLRGLLAAAAVFVVVSLVAGLLAADGREDARRQRDAARTAQEDAQLETLVEQSLALRSTNRSVAALLAIEAYRRQPDARAWSALLGTFSAAPSFLGHRYLPASRLAGTTVPGTSTAVVAVDLGDLRTLDLASGQLGGEFPPAEVGNGPRSSSAGTLVRVSGDGRYVAHVVETDSPEGCGRFASSPDSDGEGCGAFSVYEIGTGRRVLGPVTPPFQPGDLALNADGSLVAVGGGLAGDLAVYRTDGGEQVGALAGLSDTGGIGQTRDTAAVAFGPDGLVYLGSLAGPIRAVDPSTIEVVREIDAPPLSSNGHLEVTPDGLLVGGGWDALVPSTRGPGRPAGRPASARSWTPSPARGSPSPPRPAPCTAAASTA